jgi:hypothetical protein
MSIENIHREVLNTIRNDGGVMGIDCYRKYSPEYESLSGKESTPLWEEILNTIEGKEGIFDRPIMIRKDDPYLHRNPFRMSAEERREMTRYRQNPRNDNNEFGLEQMNMVLDVYYQIFSMDDQLLPSLHSDLLE